MEDPKSFDIEFNGIPAHVSVHVIRSSRVFHILFDDMRPDLNITIAEDDDGIKFWTSLPEGRQQEAELVGKIIAAYIRDYRSTHHVLL